MTRKTHYALMAGDYTVCGRFVHNDLNIRVSDDPKQADCATCRTVLDLTRDQEQQRQDRLPLLAEALHTGWRKGTEAPSAPAVHRLIADMDRADWGAYVEWVDWCLGEVGYR